MLSKNVLSVSKSNILFDLMEDIHCMAMDVNDLDNYELTHIQILYTLDTGRNTVDDSESTTQKGQEHTDYVVGLPI